MTFKINCTVNMPSSSQSANETPPAPPSLKKSSSSSKNQTSIAGFFRKKDPAAAVNGAPKINGSSLPVHSSPKKNGLKKSIGAPSQTLTPAPSSDAAEEVKDDHDKRMSNLNGGLVSNGLPSPITPAGTIGVCDGAVDDAAPKGFYSPSRKVRLLRNFSVNCMLIFYGRQKKP